MQIFQTELPFTQADIQELAHLIPCPVRDVCFFDIETTGLSPKISNVYLIGAARLVFDRFILTQWFADDYNSEFSLLNAFSEYLEDCRLVTHYNGSTFDIPYLEKKYIDYGLSSPFSFRSHTQLHSYNNDQFEPSDSDTTDAPDSMLSISLENLDIYRRVASCKNRFPVENNKLITMERYLGFNRGTDISGKECIRLYTDYMQKKYAHLDSEKHSLQKTILKHNSDDLIGTIRCAKLLYFTDYRPGSPIISTTDKSVIITDKLSDGLRFPVKLAYDNPITKSKTPIGKKPLPDSKPKGEFKTLNPVVHIEFDKDTLTVQVPLLRDTLYHYFYDYKDYYYLPDEDMAIHKSVGSFVDRHHREQANAANCYSRKDGLFLPLPSCIYPDRIPVFYRKGWTRSAAFIESDSISGINVKEYLKGYI
ncbi:MAG: ribonuclease H-like domain-containing protein [Eubacterium sp.]|nr:ribonuclease H-like domain-containing protein [Eubacterium sp.]